VARGASAAFTLSLPIERSEWGSVFISFTGFNLQIAANALLFFLNIALETSLDPNEKQSYGDH